MKKAIHDALGYLWVKNSIEAEKKRKADIEQENAKFQANVDAKWDYVYATKYWGTTELGYFTTARPVILTGCIGSPKTNLLQF